MFRGLSGAFQPGRVKSLEAKTKDLLPSQLWILIEVSQWGITNSREGGQGRVSSLGSGAWPLHLCTEGHFEGNFPICLPFQVTSALPSLPTGVSPRHFLPTPISKTSLYRETLLKGLSFGYAISFLILP